MSSKASKMTQPTARSSRKNTRRRTPLAPGTVIVRYKELLGPVQPGTRRYLFAPGATGLAHLDSRGRMYETYRLRGPVKIQYKAAVGTTVSGEVVMGADYDAKDVILTYNGTAALSPKAMSPVWRDCTLNVPHARAMKQKWLVTAPEMAYNQETNDVPTNYRDDAVAFATVVTCTASSTTGSLWVEYNIEFASPKSAAPCVNDTIYSVSSGTPTSSVTTKKPFTDAPVGAGETFYAGATKPFTYDLSTGYTLAGTGTTPGGHTWIAIREGLNTAGEQWCTNLRFGSVTGLVQSVCAGSVHAITRLLDGVTVS